METNSDPLFSGTPDSMWHGHAQSTERSALYGDHVARNPNSFEDSRYANDPGTIAVWAQRKYGMRAASPNGKARQDNGLQARDGNR